MELINYFDKYNELMKQPELYYYILYIGIGIAIFLSIIGFIMSFFAKFQKDNYLYDKIINSLAIALIIATLVLGSTVGIRSLYNVNHQKAANKEVEELCKDIQAELRYKYNTELSKQQIKVLLKKQPIWANKLTKDKVKKLSTLTLSNLTETNLAKNTNNLND